MKSKIVLFSVVAVLALFAVSAVPSASANGLDNVVYFVPEDSSGLYCENISVLIMVDALDLTKGAGMDIYFDQDCVDITNVDFTGTPYNNLTGWTHLGDHVRIGVMGPMGIPPDTHLIANLTLHCEKKAKCTSNLAFAVTELLDDDGDPLPNVIWHDGTFSCEVSCIADIEVTKTVWNGTAWVKEITAKLNDTVQFNSTIHNNGTGCDLTNIEVTDTLSDSFEYISAIPEPDGVTHNPDETTTLTWFSGPLAPCETETFLINVKVTKCGVDTNTQYAKAEGCGETVSDEDTATVNVPGVPGIKVTKTVWDGAAWVKETTANLGDSVHFKSTILNSGTCADLTNIDVTDTLPKSLEYTSATPEPEVTHNPDGTTVLTWFLPGPLAADKKKEFKINATVIECVDTIINTQNAEAECGGEIVYGEDTATVNVEAVSGIEIVKTVLDPDTGEWVDSITAELNDTVKFKLTTHNNGTCCDLTDIWVRDVLSDSFEYIIAKGDTPEADKVDYSKGGTELKWFLQGPLAPCETITYTITARVIKCGVAENYADANATAECTGDKVEDSDIATVTVPGVPGIEVTKTVWNGTAWVDEITAKFGDTVKFKSTIHNSGTCCCDLTDINVTDTLSDSFEFDDARPTPDGVTHNPDGTTTLTWFLTGPVVPDDTETFLINVTVKKCGVDTNTQYAEAKGCGETVSGKDTATVNVPGEPGIEVTKTVWNGTAWVKVITAKLGDSVEFNSTIHNNGSCDLTNIVVTDTLSDSFNYTSAIPEPDGEVHNQNGTTTLTWFLAGPLAPCETETFLINVTVKKCGVDTNTQYAEAKGCGETVSGKDTATVNVPGEPGIEVTKTVWNNESKAWVNEITAKLGDSVEFKATIHNSGTGCNLTDIDVTDTLSDSFNYTSAIPEPDGEVHNPDGTTTLTWSLAGPLAPCETETFLINATMIGCGKDTNTQNATADCGGEIVSDEDKATVNVPSEPGMEVEKMVWNGTALVKEITAKLGDTVQFNSTIYNTGACCPLTNITVIDTLPDGFEYISATPDPSKILYYPDRTELIWYPGVFAPYRAVPPANSITYTINAKVTECGDLINNLSAEAVSCEEVLSDQDTATVNVPGVPGIEVNKTVWNETAEAWEDRIKANVSDTVRFRCEIHNYGTCCPLTDIVVTDTLSDSLEYADNATVNGEPWEPTIVNPNEFKWEFPDLLENKTITIEFDTHVVKCGVDENLQKATAVGCGKTVSDEDTATVDVTGKVEPGIEVEKTVLDQDTGKWVDTINASIGDTVKFNSTVHNNGTCCNLTKIEVTDTLSDSFEYISAIPAPDGVIRNLDGTTTLTWFFSGPLVPCETLTLLIDAQVTKYGEASNKQNATAVACDDTTVSDEDYAYVSAILKPDLVITDEWLCWPDNCTICYNVTNIGKGTAPACHNTTLYVDGVAVAHDPVPVDLAPGESYSGCFDDYIWAYTPPSDNITVCADNNETVDELDEDNNCLTNIWMCGDVNCDGEVTISDVRKVFNRYLDQNYPLELPWAADVYCDGEVTMSDVRKEFNRYLDPEYDLNCCCE